MPLTEQQKKMIYHLKRHNATEDEILGVGLLLNSDSMQKDMITYLMANPMATPKECVDEAVEIRKAAE
jgi:hypothetical protein